MMRLKNRDIGPPNFFRYTHAETHHTSRAQNWFGWREAIFAHRKANELEIPGNMMELAENQICGQIPPEWCERSEKDGNPVNTRIGLGDVIAGFKTYFKTVLGLQQMVSQVEAERRAFLCAGCYLNVNPEGCGACHKMSDLIIGDLAKRSTPYDPDLKACAVCRCPAKAIVHFPISILEENDTPEKQALYPREFCWRQKESPTYLPNELAEATA